MKTLDAITKDMEEVGRSVHAAMVNCIWDRLSLACAEDDWPDDTEVWCVVQSRLDLKREGKHAAYIPDFRVKGPFRTHRETFRALGRLKPRTFLIGPIRCGDIRGHNRTQFEAEMAAKGTP